MTLLVKHINTLRERVPGGPDRYFLEFVDSDRGTVIFELPDNEDLAVMAAQEIGKILAATSTDRIIFCDTVTDMA